MIRAIKLHCVQILFAVLYLASEILSECWSGLSYTLSVCVCEGFLQLEDIGGQHDPHLRLVGCHHETLEGHNIQIMQSEI